MNKETETEIRYALSDEGLAEHSKFLESYRALRRDEKRGSENPVFYLRLPEGDFAGQRAKEWALRRESLEWLREYLSEHFAGRSLSILDAGAGNCWMTRHLAEWGHEVVALDLNDDEYDGLGAGRYYLERLPITFRRVVADFAHLPFQEGAFDLVIFNGAVHYAENLRAAVAEGMRVLKGGGEIILIDTPIYSDPKSGEKMLAERSEEGRAGYVTFSSLEEIARRLGLGLRLYFRPNSILRRVRRRLKELRLGRETASMPWVVFGKK